MFMASLLSPPEGEDAIIAHISGKFREHPDKKQSLLLLFYESKQRAGIKEKK